MSSWGRNEPPERQVCTPSSEKKDPQRHNFGDFRTLDTRGKPTSFQAARTNHIKRMGIPVVSDLSGHPGSWETQEDAPSLWMGARTLHLKHGSATTGREYRHSGTYTDSTFYLPGSLSRVFVTQCTEKLRNTASRSHTSKER